VLSPFVGNVADRFGTTRTVAAGGAVYVAGMLIIAAATEGVLLTLGNASVQMKVNGKTVKVTPSSSSIGFMLAPSGNKSLPTSQQPRCA